ncbi:MAG: EAL domain-containing protein [Rhodocyclales bacterium]|nr:EAL domain-containing protein [Rhodocyclales bacterium]
MHEISEQRRTSRLTWLAVAIWSLSLGGSLAWNLRYQERQTMDLAYAEATANLNKDITLRRWVTEHGGVYVPIGEKQQSVPWLDHVPGRDVTTTDGRRLTLLNPASVVRQLMDRYARDYGIRGRIIGLKYLNPDNAPDAWEKEQLEAFTRGEKNEVWAVADMDGQPYLRYLRAMFMEPGCEKCHAILGYKLGDMRGATGINLPLAAYYRQIDSARRNLGLTHGGIWLLGLVAIGGAAHSARRRQLQRRHDEAKRAQAEKRYRTLFEQSRDGILIVDPQDMRFVEFNSVAHEQLGYDRDEFAAMRLADIDAEAASAETARHLETVRTQGADTFETYHCHKDGSVRDVQVNMQMLVIDDQPVLHCTFRDITERKAAVDRIRNLAFYDPLTGLPNRRLLLDRLHQAVVSSARSNRYGALMLLDMDDFKTLNDTLGHDVGDRFLVEVALRLQACVREGDTVARHGGDEFVVILEDINEDTLAAMHVESVAVKVLRALNQPYLLDLSLPGEIERTRNYHCTSSIGITLFRGSAVSVDELMKRADTAMYQSKAAGRNTLRFYDPVMQAQVTARAALDSDLRDAVREDQFVLHYQPQVDAAGRTTGAEALLRWLHPRRGTVSPAEFIPAAEATGLIQPIGDRVLEIACGQLVAWAAVPGMAHLTMAVNVSARQFRHPDFVEHVLAVLESTGADARKLKLELTESLLLDDVEDVIAKMAALKAKGVGFALDDFGTGYSSLAYLKRLPLDQLKIDRSFVRDVLTDPNDAAIARTIVALAQSMGLTVIAEGVETSAQLEFLAANGCHAYQGYFFGRPVPVAEFTVLVQGPAADA